MAINLKFDSVGNPESPTIVLANRNGNKLGQLDVNVDSIDLSDKFNDASEFTFTLNKYVDGKLTNLWDKVVDFKLVYCKEWDMWFEIKVELDEATETVKTVFCTQLGQAELSQIMLYNIEINTEEDISRDDYKISILYDANDPKASILNRMFEKAPHYRIKYVDPTIARIQRSFSFDDTSICDALNDIEEEIGCFVDYDSNSDKNGIPQRAISVYDLQQNCNDCNYRGEFTDKCPKCGSTNIKKGYGEDTLIFVTSDELATEGIELVTDTDSVKNCFKLEAGDDLMTATIRNCNPNGTDYIWYFSDSIKEDMSDELVDKIESYDELYKNYYDNHESDLDENLLNNYNALVEKYKEFYNTPSTCLNCDYEGYFDSKCPQCDSGNILSGKNLQSISTPITGYSALMNAYYNTIDLALYLKSGLMPSVEMSETNAEEQAKLLTASSLSPVAVANINTVSLATANSSVLAMAKIVVRSTFKVQVNSSELSTDKKTWTGNFIVTNYSDEEDTAVSEIISVEVNGDNETFIKQKIDKMLNKENTDDYSISGLFEKEYDDFCNELKKYALNPLISFRDACQSCIDILMEQGVGDDTTSDLYINLYTPYYDKLRAVESEIKVREEEINLIVGVYDTEGNLTTKGLQTNIEECQKEIQDTLNFEAYLGEELWLEFCSYRREDKYSNSNYVSDGLNNAELFQKANEFIEVAEDEIFKSAELQHSISASLNNLLAIPKFKPLVKSFKTGNWIRVQVNDKIYKLRLLEYDISYGDFNTISVEFSDVTKIKNGTTDVQAVLSQASSMASSYDSVQRQAKKGNVARSTIDQWLADGLNAANVQIQSNNSEEVSLTKNGLLARSYDDITETYSSEQLKITHNIMAYTDDNWETVKQAIGKHSHKFYDEKVDDFVEKIGYGMSTEFVNAGYVTGSQIIGGDIYSDNYSATNRTGSYLNLRNGTFSFGGGSLRYEGGKLLISSPNIPTTETITQINEEYLKTTTVYAESLQVKAANIKEQLIASQINADGIKANNVNLTGIINAEKGGTIAGFTIGDNSIYNTKTSYNDETSDGVYLGIDGIGLGKGRFYVDKDGYVFANHVYIEGQVLANEGIIGGFTIGTDENGNNYLYSGIFGEDESIYLSTTDMEGLSDFFDGNINNWRMTVGSNFGVTSDGSLYAKSANIKGGSLLIGDKNDNYAEITEDGVLSAKGANIDGIINATEGSIGGWSVYSDYFGKNNVGIMSSDIAIRESLVDESNTSNIRFYAGQGDNITGRKSITETFEVTPLGHFSKVIDISYLAAKILDFSWLSGSFVSTSGKEYSIIEENLDATYVKYLATRVSPTKLRIMGVINNLSPSSDAVTSGVLTIQFSYNISNPMFSILDDGSMYSPTCQITSNLSNIFSKYVLDDGTLIAKMHFESSDNRFAIETMGRGLQLGADSSDDSPFTHLLKGAWWCNESLINDSDRNVKNTISDIDNKYEVLFDNLRPVTYKYNSGHSGRLHIGFIAQEVDNAIDKAELTRQDFAAVCIENQGKNNESWGIRYEEFVALNTLEIQKLKKRVMELENQLKA